MSDKGKVGFIASVIAIIVFLAGFQTRAFWELINTPAHSSSKGSWEEGVPPIPSDIRGGVPVIELGEQETPSQDSSCSFFENQTVAVISDDRGHLEGRSPRLPSYDMIGTDSIRNTYYAEDASEADASWLPTIMVPGRRLKVSYTVCGNGGIHSLKKIEMIPKR